MPLVFFSLTKYINRNILFYNQNIKSVNETPCNSNFDVKKKQSRVRGIIPECISERREGIKILVNFPTSLDGQNNEEDV